MSTKTSFAAALWLALLGVGALAAAEPPSLLSPPEKIAAPAPFPEEEPPPILGHAAYGPSEWISYHRADCCGPIGDDGPLNMEVYVRTGPSLPVAGELFAHTLTTGWMVQGGGRTLFF